MASHQINRMLDSHDKEIGKARGILARMFRKILADANIKYWEWDSLMERYLNNPRNRVPNNTKDRSSARGNLNKELYRETMTWKVFDKALRFLSPVRVRFEVHITWENKRTTIHGVDVLLGEDVISDPEEDEVEEADLAERDEAVDNRFSD